MEDDVIDADFPLGSNDKEYLQEQPDNEVPKGDEEDLAELDDQQAGPAKKKKSFNRGPKLDSKRLLSARGIPALKSYFSDALFKGKGYEVEDLDLLLSKLEHWAHRLYPKLMFPDCLEQVEALGHKKEVQTCLKRLRMGMPIVDEYQQSTVITEDGPAPDADLSANADDSENLFPAENSSYEVSATVHQELHEDQAIHNDELVVDDSETLASLSHHDSPRAHANPESRTSEV